MSEYYKENGTFFTPVYDDGRTKQAFKDECDINNILWRAQRGQSISHLQKFGGEYGDFSDVDDLLTAMGRLQRGREIFDALPLELKREFQNDLGKFFRYVNDPANRDRLPELFPALAERGRQVLPIRTQTQAPVEPPADPAPAAPTA